MKSLKSIFLSGGVLSPAQKAKLHKTWRWEREGFITVQDTDPDAIDPIGYVLITREDLKILTS